MEAARVFLIGGPAYSGTTLLALLLNQGDLVCLDEPDFEKVEQRHRGVAFLRERFPDRSFPPDPAQPLTYAEAWHVASACGRALHPLRLGFKTCDWQFVEFAAIARESGAPVVAIVRDIRDALVRPLPSWVTEQSLNTRYRMIWERRHDFDLWLRYEELARHPEKVFADLSRVLSCRLEARRSWGARDVHPPMFKTEGHELLRAGVLATHRIGIWRESGKRFSAESHATAREMGYG